MGALVQLLYTAHQQQLNNQFVCIRSITRWYYTIAVICHYRKYRSYEVNQVESSKLKYIYELYINMTVTGTWTCKWTG